MDQVAGPIVRKVWFLGLWSRYCVYLSWSRYKNKQMMHCGWEKDLIQRYLNVELIMELVCHVRKDIGHFELYSSFFSFEIERYSFIHLILGVERFCCWDLILVALWQSQLLEKTKWSLSHWSQRNEKFSNALLCKSKRKGQTSCMVEWKWSRTWIWYWSVSSDT